MLTNEEKLILQESLRFTFDRKSTSRADCIKIIHMSVRLGLDPDYINQLGVDLEIGH